MTNRVLLALACVLLAVRLPSLVQPMGADEGLYAYVGDRILAGGLPYRDAWDQKPPAIHFTYAIMRAVLPRDAAVPAADLLIAALVAVLLWRLGGATVGPWSAALFLLLSNPAFARLGGVAVRAQCETFIAAAVTGAFLCLRRERPTPSSAAIFAAGALFGLAFTFKYNAAAYVLAGVFVMWLRHIANLRSIALLSAGFAVPVVLFLVRFAAGHALRDLYDATIAYNIHYSGETYQGPWHAVAYLFTFPVRHARVDALWLVGGAGCIVLLLGARRDPDRLFAVAWVAAACLTIAINGSRDLPQYFVQAAPALALAAAWAGRIVFTRMYALSLIAGIAVSIAIIVGVWRVNDFPKLVDNTWLDARYALGRVSREEHLARYGDRATRKYSALAMDELGTFMRTHTEPSDAVYVFGFSSAAYVVADRTSASRFFWSRPVIVGFNDGKPGYAVAGLLDDLRARPPAIVALQQRDWYPDVDDSAHFFMATPALASWLRAAYTPVTGPEGFDLWTRRPDAR